MGDRQMANVGGVHNVVIQNIGDNFTYVGGAAALHLTSVGQRLRATPYTSEIDILDPCRRAIELVGREQDLGELRAWLHSERPISVRTVVGRAGAGKTRIALELMLRLESEHPGVWRAGFVSARELRRFMEQENLSAWGWRFPTLIVADYANVSVEALRVWLKELSENAGGRQANPLRILLLEREAEAAGGWLRSLLDDSYSGAGVRDLFDPLEPMPLRALDSAADRRAVLQAAMDRAAAYCKRAPPRLPAPGANARLDKQLEDPAWRDPLYLMMAALVSVHCGILEALFLSRTDLATRLARREKERFDSYAPASCGPPCRGLLSQLAASATMCGGLPKATALVAAEKECAARRLEYPGGVGSLAADVARALPHPEGGIAAITPDIVAEAFVLEVLCAEPTAQQADAVLRAAAVAAGNVTAVVVRTVQDFTGGAEASPSAAQVAAERAKAVAPMDWLEALVRTGAADDLGLLLAVESALPHQTLVLREKAVEIDSLLLERLQGKVDAGSSEALQSEVARLLNNLSVRMSALGRREEALSKAEEAVRLYEQLARARPDAFLPDLATSLNNLANMLSDLGRREEALSKAEEAVRIYEQLSRARPDAFLPYLATSRGTLGVCLTGMGRHAEAAASFRQGLVDITPQLNRDPRAFVQLAVKSARKYMEQMKAAGKEPDVAVLTPVAEAIKRVQAEDGKG